MATWQVQIARLYAWVSTIPNFARLFPNSSKVRNYLDTILVSTGFNRQLHTVKCQESGIAKHVMEL